MSNTLFLRLEGPLQSWGERGRWSIRDSAPEPTKSGVIGLVACACGYHRDEDLRRLSEHTRMGVRCDAPGIQLIDYHTIGGGYPTPMLLNAEGKLKKSNGMPHTEISQRTYLCNASFLVALQGDDPIIQEMEQAIQNPVWPIYLGRKSCPPSLPIFTGTGHYSSLKDALVDGSWSESVPLPDGNTILRTVLESIPVQGVRRRDAILSRSHRTFGPRYTLDDILRVRDLTLSQQTSQIVESTALLQGGQ